MPYVLTNYLGFVPFSPSNLVCLTVKSVPLALRGLHLVVVVLPDILKVHGRQSLWLWVLLLMCDWLRNEGFLDKAFWNDKFPNSNNEHGGHFLVIYPKVVAISGITI